MQVSADIPPAPSPFQYPLKILQRRRTKPHRSDQILVHWSEWPEHLATWEDERALKLTFLAAPAWGQAGSQDGRNVTVPGDADVNKGEGGNTADEGEGRMVPGRPKWKIKPSTRYQGPEWKAGP